jgi:hypothetical protein
MSWKPEVLVQGEWVKNGLAFATKKETYDNAAHLAFRWDLVQDFGAAESEEPVNYSYIGGKLERVKQEVS